MIKEVIKSFIQPAPAMRITNAIGRDRIAVSTLRCGRNNPGSNPGDGKSSFSWRTFRSKKITKQRCVSDFSLRFIWLTFCNCARASIFWQKVFYTCKGTLILIFEYLINYLFSAGA